MDALMRRGMGILFPIAAALTVLGGAILYWRDSDGLQWSWISSPTGIGFTVGAVAAVVSLVWGGTMVGPTTRKLEAIGVEIASSGGIATASQRAAVDVLRARLELFGKADLLLLGVAVITMATARYL
jgi:hypothetical protein